MNMKNLLKQILKALGYFAIYLAASNVVSAIVSVILGIVKGAEYRAIAADRDAYMAAFQADFASLTGVCLVGGAILTLLIYFIIEKVKKTSLAKETDIKAVPAKHLILTVTAALGGMFFMNFIMSYLPIPQELIGDLTSGMGKLTSYPFWLAILANAILVPIMEEIVFRGYIFSRLSKAMPTVVAALISSVVFGICHGGLLWAVWAFAFGMIICVIRIKSGSILPGMIFHIIMNTFAMVVSYYPVLANMTSGVMLALTIGGGLVLAGSVFAILLDKGSASAKNKAEVVISSKA